MKLDHDLRVSLGWPSHPKTRKLARDCGPGAPWLLIALWVWVAQNRPDGDLAGLDDDSIELAAGWDGEPGKFAAALARIGWIDGEPGARTVHDWGDHQPYVLERLKRAECRTGAASAAGKASAAARTPEQRKAMAAAAAAARWQEGPENGVDANGMPTACQRMPTEHANAMPTHANGCQPSPSPSPSPSRPEEQDQEKTKRRAGAREGAPAPGPAGPPRRRRAKREGGGTPGWIEEAIQAGADLPPETLPAWARWIDHLRARKKPTPGALQKHLADLARVIAAKGPVAAAKLLDESIGANAQGLQPWAVERAVTGLDNGRNPNGIRPSIMQRVQSGEIGVEGFEPDKGETIDFHEFFTSAPYPNQLRDPCATRQEQIEQERLRLNR